MEKTEIDDDTCQNCGSSDLLPMINGWLCYGCGNVYLTSSRCSHEPSVFELEQWEYPVKKIPKERAILGQKGKMAMLAPPFELFTTSGFIDVRLGLKWKCPHPGCPPSYSACYD